MKVSDLRAPLADVPESHHPVVEFSNGGRSLFDCQLISSLGYLDVFTSDRNPPMISCALPRGRICTFSHLGFAIRRYFAETFCGLQPFSWFSPASSVGGHRNREAQFPHGLVCLQSNFLLGRKEQTGSIHISR
jgi:hypothetical protein